MVSGDVVNTAARMQTAAPINGILVGDATYRATRNVIEYREAEPIQAKGKAEPVSVWEAVAARARFGDDVADRLSTSLVGRERELGALVDALERSRRELAPQLVTLVGVPGIGKSRLVAEVFQVVDRDEDLIWWRQGRSLPYGEGLSYWALGEIVKAQAGILETDEADAAETKLAVAARRPRRGRGRARLDRRPRAPTRRARRRRRRRRRPALRDALRLAAAARGARRAASARPRLRGPPLGRRRAAGLRRLPRRVGRRRADADPRNGAARTRSTGGPAGAAASGTRRRSRSRRSRATRRRSCSAELLEQTLLPAEIQSQVLARAEGNPLYAEEYVRMLQDRGFLVRRDGTWRLEREGDLPLPETVHGMIAARLDALSRDEKELVQDAAVIGKVFWPGAVAAIGDRSPFALEEPLHALERKEFIRRERRSAVAGETQYAFLHALVRDVAYGQIPRGQRADKHRLAAEWIESLSSERSEDRAEMLAHHYREALELARAAGVDAAALRAPARAALIEATRAGEPPLRVAATVDFGQAALELVDEDDPRVRCSEFRLAEANQITRANTDFDLALVGARRLPRQRRHRVRGARRHLPRADVLAPGATRPAIGRAPQHALRLVEDRPLSFAKARVFAQQARTNFAVTGSSGPRDRASGGTRWRWPRNCGDDELMSHVLNTLGMAHVALGDPVGDRAQRVGRASRRRRTSPDAIHTALNNLANMQWRLGDLDGATASLARARADQRALRLCRQASQWLDIEDMLDDELRGNWDAALGTRGRVPGGGWAARGTISKGLSASCAPPSSRAAANSRPRRARCDILLDHSREVQGEQIAPGSLDCGARVPRVPAAMSEADAAAGGAPPRSVAERSRDRPGLRELPLMLVELGRSADDYLAASSGRWPVPVARRRASRSRARQSSRRLPTELRTIRRARDGGVGAPPRRGEVAAEAAERGESNSRPHSRIFASVRATPYVRRVRSAARLAGLRRRRAACGPSASIS